MKTTIKPTMTRKINWILYDVYITKTKAEWTILLTKVGKVALETWFREYDNKLDVYFNYFKRDEDSK